MDPESDVVPVAITEDVQTRLNTLNYASSLINSNEVNLEKPARKKKLLEDLQLNSKAYSAVRTEHDEAVSILTSYNIDVAKFVEGDESKLEVVNSTVQKVNRTKMELNELREKHKEILSQCSIVEEDLRLYRSRMGMAIRKSQPYFDMQDTYNRKMADAKQVIDRLTVEVKSAKSLYAQTMSSLEAISNRIHESRRLGYWFNSPLTSPRTRGVGSEVSNSSGEGLRVAATPALSAAGRGGEEISTSLSLPSSPRHTPPGQADTDTEADSEIGGGAAFFGSSYLATLRKSAVNPLHSDVVSALHSCSLGPRLRTTQSKGEQTDLLALTVRSQHLRSQSL
ncbi:SH3 domain-binding protein 5 [Taenia crassiceps]|uniref:SH3 domain-binding protein 5 n=1 Tax=Taenia crassiceps TaxID=6207 RepID=A0ABR4Q1A6_9CEST